MTTDDPLAPRPRWRHRLALLLALGAVVLAAVFFVPGIRYDHHVLNGRPMRVDRITGRSYLMVRGEWRPILTAAERGQHPNP